MGTSDPPHSTESRHRQGKLSVDASSKPAALGDSHMKSKNAGVWKRPATMQLAGSTKELHRHVRKPTNSTEEQENTIADFQITLTKRDQEIGKHRVEYTKLQHKNRDLLETIEAREKTVKEQDKLIQEQRKTIEEQDKRIKKKETLLNWQSRFLNRTIDEYLRPYSQRNGENIQMFTEDLFLDVLVSLVREAAERGAMQDQLLTLQQELLGRVEKVHVASDDHFAQEFRAIASLIKTLSRTICVASGVDVTEALGTGCLQQDVSRHQWASRARKKLLVEAWVWSVLIDNVFRTPFSVYGKNCAILSANWQSLFLAEHYNGWPIPTSLSENWRCVTMESMFTLVDQETITHGKVNDVPKNLESVVIATRDSIKSTIESGLDKISSDPDVSQVSNIVNKAFALAVQMSLQKFRLQVTYPAVGDQFAAESMDYLPDPDGEDVDDGVVAFVVNPGLTKWGDAHGKNLDHRYDIVSSLVQLEVSHEKGVVRKTEHDSAGLLSQNYRVAVPRPEDMKACKSYRESQR